MILDRVRLDSAHLVAELHTNASTDFLRVHSRSDPTRDLLLPLRDAPLCGALARFTRLGRLHALYWTLAYGELTYTGSHVVHGSMVSFTRRTYPVQPADALPIQLGDRYWVCDVEGLYDDVCLLSEGVVVSELPIAAAVRA